MINQNPNPTHPTQHSIIKLRNIQHDIKNERSLALALSLVSTIQTSISKSWENINQAHIRKTTESQTPQIFERCRKYSKVNYRLLGRVLNLKEELSTRMSMCKVVSRQNQMKYNSIMDKIKMKREQLQKEFRDL